MPPTVVLLARGRAAHRDGPDPERAELAAPEALRLDARDGERRLVGAALSAAQDRQRPDLRRGGLHAGEVAQDRDLAGERPPGVRGKVQGLGRLDALKVDELDPERAAVLAEPVQDVADGEGARRERAARAPQRGDRHRPGPHAPGGVPAGRGRNRKVADPDGVRGAVVGDLAGGDRRPRGTDVAEPAADERLGAILGALRRGPRGLGRPCRLRQGRGRRHQRAPKQGHGGARAHRSRRQQAFRDHRSHPTILLASDSMSRNQFAPRLNRLSTVDPGGFLVPPTPRLVSDAERPPNDFAPEPRDDCVQNATGVTFLRSARHRRV